MKKLLLTLASLGILQAQAADFAQADQAAAALVSKAQGLLGGQATVTGPVTTPVITTVAPPPKTQAAEDFTSVLTSTFWSSRPGEGMMIVRFGSGGSAKVYSSTEDKIHDCTLVVKANVVTLQGGAGNAQYVLDKTSGRLKSSKSPPPNGWPAELEPKVPSMEGLKRRARLFLQNG